MLYWVSVDRHLNRVTNCDIAYIQPLNEPPFDGVPEAPPTNCLSHTPPVDNNISRYSGTFAAKAAAVECVKRDFPLAVIRGLD